jgi:nitrile hydratase alpha subunit
MIDLSLTLEVLMSSAPITSRRMAEEMLVQRAAQDDAFRKQLVTDPKTAIFEAFGFRIPSDVRITVIEETSDEVYLVLPASCASAELAERELAMVAGGAELKDSASSSKWTALIAEDGSKKSG